MLKHRTVSIIVTLALATAGCTKMGEFPSLAKRPFEQGGPALAEKPVAAVDPARLARLAALHDRAQDGAGAFASAFSDAQRSVNRAQGAGVGSEGWIDAQVAVSRLEPLRLPAQTALSDLTDELRTFPADSSTDERAQIETTIAQVQAIKDEQDDNVARLIAALTR